MSFADRVKRRARRGAASLAANLPADRGPQVVQTVAARARLAEAARLLRGARDPRGALAAAERLTSTPAVAADAWALVAEAREAMGQGRDALAAARSATAGAPSVDALLVHLRLAERHGEPDEAREVRLRLAAAAPADAGVERVAAALRSSDSTTVDALEAALEQRGGTGWQEAVARLRVELAIVGADGAAVWAAVDAARGRLVHPEPVIVRGLARRGDWGVVARAAATIAPPDTSRRETALELRRAASEALKAGRAGAAATLASRSLELHPDDRWARDTLANAQDQVRIADEGWAAPVTSAPSHTPRPRAVLSVLAQSLPIRSGGYATRSHGILTGLAAGGWDVEAVTRLGFPYDSWPAGDTRQTPEHDVVDGIAYHRVLTPGRRAYPQFPLADYVSTYADALEAHARRHGASLLHASSFHVNGLATREVAARLGIPYVYEMRGLEDLMKVSRDPSFTGTDRDRFLTEVELASCAGAERVFVITEALRREMAARGVPEEKLVVLPNGVHADRFEPRPRDTELEARLGLTDRTVIGYAGSLVDYEGHELLLEAVDLLRRDGRDDFRVVIVGDGAHADAVHRAAARLDLGSLVTFTGRVPHDEVARYLSLFDITPFPRLPLPVCEMISPIKPFEAMASGRAAVVSSVAALTEIVEHERTGLVFDKGSAPSLAAALARLLDDPALRVRLGESARDWVRRERDWSSIVGIVDEVYREVLPTSAAG